MRNILTALILSLVLVGACAKPPTDPEVRAKKLGLQLRCPVCRGVPIADSPAELARQMMDIVKQQVAEGKTDAEILKFFEERYGEWVLLQPKPQGSNLIVWALPALFLVGGAAAIVVRLRKGGGGTPIASARENK